MQKLQINKFFGDHVLFIVFVCNIWQLFSESFQIFHELVRQDKSEHQGQATHFGLGPAINISVRRSYLYEDAFEKLSPDNGKLSN
jgi:hypothetical protein